MADPAVTIVICTRNRARQLPGALAALANIDSRSVWEAIIVDNASTDGTAEVIQQFAQQDPRIRYLRVDRIGLGAGRDAAWRAARGGIVCYTDDDCYANPDFVDAVVQAFGDFPQAGVIGGRILLHDPTDAPVTIDERREAARYPARSVVLAGDLQGANLSFRRSALELAGGFDPELGAGTPFPCEDVDAVARVVWAGMDAYYDPRPTVFHHHGRKESDLPKLFVSYDAGRGAYWAKFMLRSDTRLAYLKRWLMASARSGTAARFLRLKREIRSGIAYAAQKKRYGSIVMAAPLLVSVLAFGRIRLALNLK